MFRRQSSGRASRSGHDILNPDQCCPAVQLGRIPSAALPPTSRLLEADHWSARGGLSMSNISPIADRVRDACVVPAAWVHAAADKLIEKYGGDAMTEAGRLLSVAVTRRELDRVLIMLRVQFAVAALQLLQTDRR